MKKIFTLFLSILIYNISFAQVTPKMKLNPYDKPILSDKVIMSGDEALSNLMINPNPTTVALRIAAATETLIGTTTYDLQSNGSVMDRIIRHSGGEMSAAWTMSQLYSNTYTDRGTGYVYFDGASWGPMPSARIENSRCGWPTMLITGSGKEMVAAHNTDNSYFQLTECASGLGTCNGNGAWGTDQPLFQDPATGLYRDLVWNRTAVGGIQDETLHMIGVTAPTGLAGTLWNGMDGALLYFRSQDEGVTWDIVDLQLPTLDTSNFLRFGGDSYAIDANGETVVIAVFNDFADSFIMKSTNNGTNWTKTNFIDFPVDKYAADDGLDLDNNGVFDMVYSTDNYGTVILDNANVAHIFTGNMRYLDDDLTDGNYSWFPLTNGLLYWNETMGADITPPYPHPNDTDMWYSDAVKVIAQAKDLNCDNMVAGIDSSGGYALYYSSLASFPSAGITTSGDLYVTFSAYTENADDGTQVFRHVNIVRSTDGGSTWSEPIDITPQLMFNGMQECVFASMVQEVDNKVRLTYQKDFYPGLAVRGDEDLIDLNEIIYLELDIASETWCDRLGCTDSTASNYDPNADCDDGCCVYGLAYECVGGNCVQDPNGSYSSLTACQAACVIAASWDCDPTFGCYDPGTGNGQYSTQTSCDSACVIASWDCDASSNSCYDPGTGNGQYPSLSLCQAACGVQPSWECDIVTGCYDPGNGGGMYSTLAACQAVCVSTNISENNQSFLIYPNPSNGTITVDFAENKKHIVTIKNLVGQEVYSNIYFSSSTGKIDISSYEKGVYLITIKDEAMNNYINKIVLE